MTNGNRRTTWLMLSPVLAIAWLGTSCRVARGQANESEQKESERQQSGIQEMIARALRHHPSVTAAQAKLHEAQANLEQARLVVAQQVVDYQQSVRILEAKLRAAVAKLQEKLDINMRAPGAVTKVEIEVLKSEVEAIRAELAALKSKAPFIQGAISPDGDASRAASNDERELAEEMLAHAGTAHESAHSLYIGGKTSVDEVLHWSKKLMEAEERVHGESAAIAQRYLQRAQGLANIVEGKYRQGVESVLDYHASQYSLSEAKLILKKRSR